MKPNWIVIGACSAAIAVLFGAAGTHGLRDHMSAGDFEGWKTGVLYQAIHALALVLFGVFVEGRRRDGHVAHPAPGWLFLLGSIVFSGPLYAHGLGAPTAVLHAAPIGGLSLIAGWIAFAFVARARA